MTDVSTADLGSQETGVAGTDGTQQPRPPSRPAMGHRVWLAVHKYVGLFVGALFVLIDLTGSILAFWQSIDEWLNADIMRVEVGAQAVYRPLDEIVGVAKSAMQAGATPTFVTLPRHAGAPAGIFYTVPTFDQKVDFHEVFVDPYAVKVTSQRVAGRDAHPFATRIIYVIMSLHYTLLLGHENGLVVGLPALFLLVSVIVGLYLWWPRNGKWHQAFTIKRRASVERLTLDIHKTVGLYLSAVLIVLLFSGIYMIFKLQVRPLVALFSPVREEPMDLKSTPIPGQPTLGLAAAAAIADKVFPDGKLHFIMVPKGPEGVYAVGKQAGDEPNQVVTYRNVTVDQYSGQVLHIQDRAKFAAGEKFLECQYPLHSGEAVGNVGRAFIMVTGFVPRALLVTGFLGRLQKRRARREVMVK